MSWLVANIGNFLISITFLDKFQIRLNLESARKLVINNDLPDFHHGFIDLRVVIEESLSCVKIANRFVDVQFVQKCLQSWESVAANA